MNKSWKPHPQKISYTFTYLPFLKQSRSDEQDMWNTAREVMFPCGPLNMDEQVLDVQLELI